MKSDAFILAVVCELGAQSTNVRSYAQDNKRERVKDFEAAKGTLRNVFSQVICFWDGGPLLADQAADLKPAWVKTAYAARWHRLQGQMYQSATLRGFHPNLVCKVGKLNDLSRSKEDGAY